MRLKTEQEDVLAGVIRESVAVFILPVPPVGVGVRVDSDVELVVALRQVPLREKYAENSTRQTNASVRNKVEQLTRERITRIKRTSVMVLRARESRTKLQLHHLSQF